MSVYLDHAASTPMLPAALEAMTGALAQAPGNASSQHSRGRHVRRLIEESRESVAAGLGARPSEVIFTAGGTESDNLAVKGIYWARRKSNPTLTRIVASRIEHHAVLDAIDWLEQHEGASVTWLDVDSSGVVHPETFRAAMGSDVALATVMWANNEVGSIQPIRELTSIATQFGVPVHSDAIQAVGHIPVDFGESGLAALSVAGHKFGGPHGVGALLLRRDVAVEPLAHGGGHERAVRSGTQNTAAIVAMAAALNEPFPELRALRDDLLVRVVRSVPDAVCNSAVEGLPGIAHFTFRGCEGDSLLMLLDAAGIECSTGSACTSGVATPSHVLLAMGVDPRDARGSLRFSLGWSSTSADVDALVDALPEAVARAKTAGLANARR